MTLIEWQDEFLTGVDVLDEQHRHLVAIINKFQEAHSKGRAPRAMNEILNDLIGYTQEHFTLEEKLMAAAGYSQLPLHQSQHRQLLQKVERFQFEYNDQGKRITSDIHEFLKYWFTSHILKADKAYAPLLTDPDEALIAADTETESSPQ